VFTGFKALWLALSVLVFLCVQSPLFSETWRVEDQVYEQVRVHEVTPADVTIFHAGGIKKFSLGELPKALQERFWYDPEEAAGWEAYEARQRAEAREAMEAEAAERKAAALARKQPERQRPRSAVFRMAPPENVAFYPEVDLRPFYIEKGLYSKNQGRRPSCSVFAVVSALEYEQARRTGQAEPLSEDFLIWATLQLQPGIPLDTGFNFPEVITALQTYGVPSHAVMPNTYGKSASEIQPPPAAMEAARDRTSVIPVWFRHDDPYLVERLVAVLNQGKPVIIAVRWPHWRTLHGNYLLKNQKPLEGAAHAVTLVGYRNTGGASGETKFIFRNSYGYDWGLAGCGFISDSYLREHLLGACFLRMPVD
jgi:hypothetical protein